MTTALEEGEGSASRPGRSLPPGKTRYPLYRRLGGPQGRSGQVRKISSPPEFDPRIVQHVASRYTDYATGPTDIYSAYCNLIHPPFICSWYVHTRSNAFVWLTCMRYHDSVVYISIISTRYVGRARNHRRGCSWRGRAGNSLHQSSLMLCGVNWTKSALTFRHRASCI